MATTAGELKQKMRTMRMIPGYPSLSNEARGVMNYPAASGRGINKENIFNIAASGGE